MSRRARGSDDVGFKCGEGASSKRNPDIGDTGGEARASGAIALRVHPVGVERLAAVIGLRGR